MSDFATLEDVVGTYHDERQPRMGFFTDTSICIGCKACEVACKEWNVIPDDGVRGAGAFFLLLDEPEVYGLPPDPIDPVHDLASIWAAAGAAAVALGAGIAVAFLGGRR